jgi:hypothetical protein
MCTTCVRAPPTCANGWRHGSEDPAQSTGPGRGSLLAEVEDAATQAGPTSAIGVVTLHLLFSLIVAILGNQSADGALPAPPLPPPWKAIGPALPPGAGARATRFDRLLPGHRHHRLAAGAVHMGARREGGHAGGGTARQAPAGVDRPPPRERPAPHVRGGTSPGR